MSVHRYTGPGYDFELDIPDGWMLTQSEYQIRLQQAQNVLSDLDRCEHGRHVGDVCGGTPPGGCDGPSHGNIFISPGKRIGTTLGGYPIVVPDWTTKRVDLGDASLWVP